MKNAKSASGGRKVIVTEFLSLDGVFEAPGPDGSGFKYEGCYRLSVSKMIKQLIISA